ncbi:MAG: hypothetical protein U0610_08460 [bacterium]
MIDRASLQQARYRVILKALPADEAALATVREILQLAGLADDEIGRVLARVPCPVVTGVGAERAREVAGALARAGADVEIVSPPIGAPVRASAAERAARAQHDSSKLGWLILVGVVALALVVWVVLPPTTRLELRLRPGDSYAFARTIELRQSIQRQASVVEAKGSVRYRIERTVQSASAEEVVVVDRFRDAVFDLDVSGDSVADYQAHLERLRPLMTEAQVVRHFNRSGKLGVSEREQELVALDPYPGFVDVMLGEISFPPRSVKAGQSWDSAIDLVQSIRFHVEAPEKHLGVSTIPTNLETTSQGTPRALSSAFSNSGNEMDVSGRAWFDRKTGLPVELDVELVRTRFAQGAGNYAMDKIRAHVSQRLVP